MARRLATRVLVRDPGTGHGRVLGPDDDLPDWAEKTITNPNVWADAESADDAGGASDEGSGAGERPPTAGPGSGRDAWAAYAATEGVTVTDDMSRADIIAALPEE